MTQNCVMADMTSVTISLRAAELLVFLALTLTVRAALTRLQVAFGSMSYALMASRRPPPPFEKPIAPPKGPVRPTPSYF